MSSILEALKKLEAEKNSPLPSEPLPVDDAPDYGGGSFLADSDDGFPRRRTSIAPLLWVLGGGMFTLMVIGVAVLLVMLLMQRPSGNSGLTAIAPAPPPTASPTNTEPVIPSAEAPATTEPINDTDTTALASSEAALSETVEPLPSASEAPMVVTRVAPTQPTPPPAPVQERSTPEPVPVVAAPRKPVLPVKINTEPLPLEIRNLPMLSRTQRTQYRLEGIQLNMLNPAGPTRPLGNAFINLEKVFVGEFLPGSNAKLVDVASHGIAIEIQSTGQRYYIPR